MGHRKVKLSFENVYYYKYTAISFVPGTISDIFSEIRFSVVNVFPVVKRVI